MTTVAIVGGGAAGVVTAAHLARRWPAESPLRVLLYDAGAQPGRGVAYSTSDRKHLLNVPATNMSGLADDPLDFVEWLRQRDPDVDPDSFRPRTEYGDYLAETLADCAAAIGLVVRRATVSDVVPAGERLSVLHADGEDVVDAVVLALGYAPPADPQPVTTPTSRGYIRDPWAPGAMAELLDCTRAGDVVFLIGCGLTGTDIGLTLAGHGRRVLAVSRTGWLPRAHRRLAADPFPLSDDAVTPLTAGETERLVTRHLRAARAAGLDWRAGVDGLRPVTSRLWSRLPVEERKLLLAGPARSWEVLRHRMPPEVAERVEQLRGDGILTVCKAQLIGAAGEERAWQVTLRRDDIDHRIDVAAVVNCTGATCDITRYPGGLGRRLLAAGVVQPDPLGLGICTTDDGAVIDRDGHADGRLWTLGALRRGSLYESTAMPELRAQAAVIASRLAERYAVTDRADIRPAHRLSAT